LHQTFTSSIHHPSPFTHQATYSPQATSVTVIGLSGVTAYTHTSTAFDNKITVQIPLCTVLNLPYGSLMSVIGWLWSREVGCEFFQRVFSSGFFAGLLPVLDFCQSDLKIVRIEFDGFGSYVTM